MAGGCGVPGTQRLLDRQEIEYVASGKWTPRVQDETGNKADNRIEVGSLDHAIHRFGESRMHAIESCGKKSNAEVRRGVATSVQAVLERDKYQGRNQSRVEA